MLHEKIVFHLLQDGFRCSCFVGVLQAFVQALKRDGLRSGLCGFAIFFLFTTWRSNLLAFAAAHNGPSRAVPVSSHFGKGYRDRCRAGSKVFGIGPFPFKQVEKGTVGR